VLRETGIKVLADGAREIMREVGADVDEAAQNVRYDDKLIDKVPCHCAV